MKEGRLHAGPPSALADDGEWHHRSSGNRNPADDNLGGSVDEFTLRGPTPASLVRQRHGPRPEVNATSVNTADATCLLTSRDASPCTPILNDFIARDFPHQRIVRRTVRGA